MSEQMVLAGLGTGLSIGLSGQDSRTRQLSILAFGAATTLGRVLPHSRSQESEADYIGLIYMAKAGYPPEAAVTFWERFRDYNAKKGGQPPAFLSTHPADEKRIADLQARVPEAEVHYKTSGRSKTAAQH
jgi:predicted Zn-dependent protease